MGTPVCIFLQYCNRDFFRFRRLKDSFLFSCRIFHIKYRRGYFICQSISSGSCRHSMGNFFVSGRKLHPGCFYRMDKTEKISISGKTGSLWRRTFEKDYRNRRSKRLAAKLHLCRKYSDSKRNQRIWSFRYGRIFRRSKIKQSGYYVFHNNRQRHFQLFGAKSRRPEI